MDKVVTIHSVCSFICIIYLSILTLAYAYLGFLAVPFTGDKKAAMKYIFMFFMSLFTVIVLAT